MSIWLQLRWLLRLWILLAATTFTPPVTFAYDGQHQTTVAYDITGESACGYDAVSVLATDEKKNGTVGSRVLFAKFAELVAAKTGGQLEFEFAKDFGKNSGLVIGRGADLSAPGALGAGEYKLGWFSVQKTSMEAEWAVNRAKLQNVMNQNLPIRDASPLSDVDGFYLNRERDLLRSSRWTYQNGYWIPQP